MISWKWIDGSADGFQQEGGQHSGPTSHTSRVDERAGWREHPTMTKKSKVKRRLVLPDEEPELSKPRRRPSKEECLRAMDEAPLQPTTSWEDLASLTREP